MYADGRPLRRYTKRLSYVVLDRSLCLYHGCIDPAIAKVRLSQKPKKQISVRRRCFRSSSCIASRPGYGTCASWSNGKCTAFIYLGDTAAARSDLYEVKGGDHQWKAAACLKGAFTGNFKACLYIDLAGYEERPLGSCPSHVIREHCCVLNGIIVGSITRGDLPRR